MNAPDTSQVARRRAAAPHTSMFLRMLVRAAVLRRGRAASALLAMVVAAAVATAMLNLYVDVQAKLSSEFRKYGANVVVIAGTGRVCRPILCRPVRSVWVRTGSRFPSPMLLPAPADGHSVVVAGTDFEQVQKLDSTWWSVTVWPKASHDALVGTRAVSVAGPSGKPFDLSFQGRTIQLNPVGTLQTGAAEDSRVYVSLADFAEWTNVPYSTIEISASGSPQEISATIQTRAGSPRSRRPRRPPGDGGEASVLGKMRSTLLVAAILHHSHRCSVRAFHSDRVGFRSPPRLCPHEGPGRFREDAAGFFRR